VRMLRLSTSDDQRGRVRQGTAAFEVVERSLELEIGQPIESIVRPVWPDSRLPSLIDRWLEQDAPDFVFLRINGFWFNYESVPLRLERRLGPVGRPVARLGRRSGEIGWVSRSRAVRALRRSLLRVVGGDTYFTPEQVVERMEQCIRQILRKEDVQLVVRGTDGRIYSELPRRSAMAYARRHRQVNDALRHLCEDMHVPYLGGEEMLDERQVRQRLGADRFHRGEEGHRLAGEEEAEAFLRLWRTSVATRQRTGLPRTP
jgi:hypothetical protein